MEKMVHGEFTKNFVIFNSHVQLPEGTVCSIPRLRTVNELPQVKELNSNPGQKMCTKSQWHHDTLMVQNGKPGLFDTISI